MEADYYTEILTASLNEDLKAAGIEGAARLVKTTSGYHIEVTTSGYNSRTLGFSYRHDPYTCGHGYIEGIYRGVNHKVFEFLVEFVRKNFTCTLLETITAPDQVSIVKALKACGFKELYRYHNFAHSEGRYPGSLLTLWGKHFYEDKDPVFKEKI